MLQARHFGGTRTAVQCLQKLFEGVGIAFSNDLYTVIQAVSSPANQPQAAGLIHDEISKSDTLYPAEY